MSTFLRENFPEYRKKIPVREMPNFLLKIISIFDRSVARFVSDLEIKKEVNVSPAHKVLGWQPRSPEESIEAGARSLIDLGIV
jgi:dihydroflavonol-4-reductase